MARPKKELSADERGFVEQYLTKFDLGKLEDLTPIQRQRMLTCYRVNLKRKQEACDGIKRYVTVTLSTEAHKVLSDVARNKMMTMSELVLDTFNQQSIKLGESK